MISEDYFNKEFSPVLTNQKGKTISYIFTCVMKACIPFKKASSQDNLHQPLNENKLTQIFVEQVEVFLKPHPNIGIKNQYSDTFYGTKGIPDFYFHKVEEGVHNQPIIVFEAKILSTSFNKEREKEYVIGNNKNGGIERFKKGIHGKGLNNCGLLGFIENETPIHWEININNWIKDLASKRKEWKVDEVLSLKGSNTNYCFLNSIAHRKNSDIRLFHIWIILN